MNIAEYDYFQYNVRGEGGWGRPKDHVISAPVSNDSNFIESMFLGIPPL